MPAAPFLSSSVQVADQIKTLDFSLPSSYDSLSDAKASVANVDDLSVAYTKPAIAYSKRTTAPAIKSADDDSGPGVMGAILPSLNKSGPGGSASSDASPPAKAVKTMDSTMPTYNF